VTLFIFGDKIGLDISKSYVRRCEMAFSLHVENYLKNIYLLQSHYARVPTAALAERLGVSSPSVTSMVRKLARMGLLAHEPYKGVSLTRRGEVAALRIIRAHRLWEAYLVEAVGLSWDQAHVEAERLEHALSDELADRLDEMLDHPETDPHGHPIPTRDGEMPLPVGTPLAELLPGTTGAVLQVRDDTPELLRYLGGLRIYPREAIAVLEVAPFDGPIHIRVGGTDQVLGREVAQHVIVAPDDKDGTQRAKKDVNQ
jgi:DtxR family Mn-dependent transcriptional regulator